MHNRSGFSLLDLIISMAIFAIISVAFISIFVVVVNIQGYENSQSDGSQQSHFLVQQLQYYIANARIADMSLDASTSTLTLRTASTSTDPTVISLSSGTVYIRQGLGAGQAQALKLSYSPKQQELLQRALKPVKPGG